MPLRVCVCLCIYENICVCVRMLAYVRMCVFMYVFVCTDMCVLGFGVGVKERVEV